MRAGKQAAFYVTTISGPYGFTTPRAFTTKPEVEARAVYARVAAPNAALACSAFYGFLRMAQIQGKPLPRSWDLLYLSNDVLRPAGTVQPISLAKGKREGAKAPVVSS